MVSCLRFSVSTYPSFYPLIAHSKCPPSVISLKVGLEIPYKIPTCYMSYGNLQIDDLLSSF